MGFTNSSFQDQLTALLEASRDQIHSCYSACALLDPLMTDINSIASLNELEEEDLERLAEETAAPRDKYRYLLEDLERMDTQAEGMGNYQLVSQADRALEYEASLLTVLQEIKEIYEKEALLILTDLRLEWEELRSVLPPQATLKAVDENSVRELRSYISRYSTKLEE